MEKLNELLKDRNNQIIAIAIIVIIIVIAVVAIFLSSGKSGSKGDATPDPSTVGLISPTAGAPSPTTGAPGSTGTSNLTAPLTPPMPGVTGVTANPTVSAPAASAAPAAAAAEPEKKASIQGPMEPGKADPFAPAGTGTVNRTKTMGNKIKTRFVPPFPTSLYSVAFTEVDYGSLGKLLKAKSAKELEEEERAKAGEIPKPTNIRLSGIMTMSGSVKVAMFEILDGTGDNMESCRVGEKLTIGYDMKGDKVTATVKEINDDEEYAILEPDQGKVVRWKYSVTAGNQTSPYGTGYGTGMGGYDTMGTMGGMTMPTPTMPTPTMPGMGGGYDTMGGMSMPTPTMPTPAMPMPTMPTPTMPGMGY